MVQQLSSSQDFYGRCWLIDFDFQSSDLEDAISVVHSGDITVQNMDSPTDSQTYTCERANCLMPLAALADEGIK